MLCIVNYGSGNIAAIENICRREKIPHYVTGTPEGLAQGERYLLPGVGSFDPTMETLETSGLTEALRENVLTKGRPLLGICVGMQLLADGSEEGAKGGLGWIPGRVRRIRLSPGTAAPHLPHMGWNDIRIRSDHPVLAGVDSLRGFYFLHSFYFDALRPESVIATVSYGDELPCAVASENVVGVQFHPEKSHANGVRVIKNFAGWL